MAASNNVVVDEMFPEGSGSFMDIDDGIIPLDSSMGKEVGMNWVYVCLSTCCLET
jgi:hypothetical protein